MRRLQHFLLAACGVAIIESAVAHHSFAAIWDETRELQVEGILSGVQWINPHSYFEVEVTNDDGSVDTYSFENFPPRMLLQLGMSRSMMVEKIGQEVAVLYNPARDGTPTLGYGRVFEFKDGPRIVFTGATAGVSE